MPRFPYTFFNNFAVRQPVFLRGKFQNFADQKEIDIGSFKKICSDPVFQEAIYLASPYLHKELDQWLAGKEFSLKAFQKLKHTALKYYSRMSIRCTPFGLFSGVGLGEFCNKNYELEITNDEKLSFDTPSTVSFIRDTTLDMHFLVALADHFVKTPEIRSRLLFFPNNSIYKVGSKIRYVEYEYNKGKRDYIISSAFLSEELQQVLDFSKQGKTIGQITEILINDEVTQQEAREFVDELIENQILVSELEPNVSGTDFLDSIISVLNKTEGKEEAENLISIKTQLDELDSEIGNPVSKYAEIEKRIQSFDTEYDQKYLFQTDLYSQKKLELPIYWKKELKKSISFLNKITIFSKETHIEKFKKAFYERFETQEMPLSYVLDTELGIGYTQNTAAKGIHPYLEDLTLPVSQKKQNLNIQLTPIHKILNDTVQEALLENRFIIELSDEDFNDFDANWQDLPDTLSFMTEIVSENGQEKIFLSDGGGCSAAKLIARFCSEKSEIQSLAKTIANKEEMLRQAQHDNNDVLAEIIHLPDARIGNVIRRPSLRNYEIPYLAKSVLPEENQISVDDLFISLKNNQIILRSKKLNKEVKPYLTNAHNYVANSLPVYHFLCDLYSQNKRAGLHFDWGDLKQVYRFLPRVEYKNAILSKAWWRITEKELESFSAIINHKEKLLSSIKTWREKRKIPQWIQWVKSDNTVTMNLENYDMAILFIQTVKNEKSITIKEFLYNENDNFTREFIFSMYKEEDRKKRKEQR